MERLDDVTAAWDDNAEDWISWARAPEHDIYYWQLNLPAFAEIIPMPGRRTIDLGCGEGRLGRWLAERGHQVAGVDSSPTLVDSARRAGGYDEVVCADAVATPWGDGEFDVAVAFMSLQDIPNLADTVRETARVLAPGGALCIAIVHPLNRPAEHLDSYFTERRVSEAVTQDGLTMTFNGIDRPMESYTRALFDNGFVIESLREPRATAEAVERVPSLAPAADRPYFLHLRSRLSSAHRSSSSTPRSASRQPL